MSDVGSGQETYSNVIVTAQYQSVEGEERREIALIDAVAPLLGPPSHQLLLSSPPISEPWPLALVDDTVEGNDKQRAKIRRLEDEISLEIERLHDLLRQDIPTALEQLRISLKDKDDQWLTLAKAERYTIADSGKCEEHGGLDCIQLEASVNARKSREGKAQEVTSLQASLKLVPEDLVHRLVANESDSDTLISFNDVNQAARDICMPPRSSFLLTNLLRGRSDLPEGWQQILSYAEDHPPNLILLDPPYPNFSAKRLKSKQEAYEPVTDLYDLWKLKEPVLKLLDRGSKNEEDGGVLVGCWITNHANVHRFVLTKLFPAWGLHHVGQLVWIKVTTRGQLVFPLKNKQGRKPYEILLLARSKPSKALLTPRTTLFASVPLGHSRKPAVYDLLRSLVALSSQVNVYEFFARTLFPGPLPRGTWVSIGNGPFRFSQEGVGYITHSQGQR